MDRRHFLATAGIATLAGCTSFDGTDDGEGTGGADDAGPAGAPNETASGNGTEPDDEGPADGTSGEERASNRHFEDPIHAKVDLHSHLRAGGGQAMADRYAELGFDALVGTDHSNRLGVPGEPTAEQVGDYSDLEFPGPILNGVELSADHHVNVIESEHESIAQLNHPNRYGDDAADLRELAERVGADLIEVTEGGAHLGDYPTVADVAADTDLNPTVTSDAHEVADVGAGFVVAEVPELTGDEILWALERGHYALSGTRMW